MKLIDWVKSSPSRKVIPLAGYPGIKLTGSSVRETLENPELQVRSLKVLFDRIQPDGILPIMDLTVEAQALGVKIQMPDQEAPSVVDHPLKSPSDLQSLTVPDPIKSGRMPVYLRVAELLKAILPDVARGCYAIGPFTLAGEMVGVEPLSFLLYENPEFARAAIEFSAQVTTAYLKAQLGSGATFGVILEPTAVILSPKMFNDFCLPALKIITQSIPQPIVLHICGDTEHLLEGMKNTGAQGLSLDSPVDLPAAAKKLPSDLVLIGNLHPVEVMVELSQGEVREKTRSLLSAMSGFPNFILSSGCDLPPETPIENIHALVQIARSI
ncbi:MAG: uroporphyrinogen decarboxylase family protein [Proteobacteria bacterium]|nr:uroporphyrinogen decarboxylase family protein [Pseudomonadota bacterium]